MWGPDSSQRAFRADAARSAGGFELPRWLGRNHDLRAGPQFQECVESRNRCRGFANWRY
jgi:hypothetical protein